MSNPSKFSGGLFRRLLTLTLLLVGASNLSAQQAVSVSLSGSNEVPPVTTSASGSAEITVLPDRTVNGSIKTSGMNPTMAHIHEAAPGSNGPPIVTLTQTGKGGFVVPPNTRLSDAQYMSYKAGNLYVNVHSAPNPDGEIRGQISPGR